MERVLIVEDNKMIAKVVTHIITRELGFECVVAHTMFEAKRILKQDNNDFLVAVLDLNLPDAPDGEVVDYVLELGLSVIVLTGSYSDTTREEFLKKPIVDYVVKESRYSYEYVSRIIGRLDRNRNIKALVVDDSLSARGFISSLLQHHNYQVVDAVDGQQALEVLADNPDIRLVITDYNMPNMDGFQLTTAIRQEHDWESIAIIGLSAQGSGSLSAKFIKNGANDFLTKPFSHEEFYCRLMQNIEALEHIEAIRDSANRDYLTKLYNRRYFFRVSDVTYEKAQKEQLPLSVAMIDIDHFKSINDNYGHDVGDQVLLNMAELLNMHLGSHLVARFGGEEFCVMFDSLKQSQAYEILEQFRQKVEHNKVHIDDNTINYTISIGLSDAIEDDLDELIQNADHALYRAKNGGRNQVMC